MFYSGSVVRVLQAQIDDLKERLAASEAERKALLDRILAKNNVEPVNEVKNTQPQSTINVIAPFGVQPQDIEEPLRESWIAEEAEYLEGKGFDPSRARAEAENRYLAKNLSIKLN